MSNDDIEVRSASSTPSEYSSHSSPDDVETLSEATHSSYTSDDEAEVSSETAPMSDIHVEGETTTPNLGSTIQNEHNDDDDDEMCTCSDAEPNVSPVGTCSTRPPPPTRLLASPVPYVFEHPISTPITTQRSPTYPPDHIRHTIAKGEHPISTPITNQRSLTYSPNHIGRTIAERDTARAINEGLIPDDGAGIFPDGPTRLRLCKARLQRIADECARIKTLEAATKQQSEGYGQDITLPATARQPLSTQPSPVPLDFEHPISAPNACTTRPIPKRAPPPSPMAGPNGFWRVGGYTAQGCEALTYHSHTHTPITKPRAKWFEHGVRPFVEDFSTKVTAEIHRSDTDAHARHDAHAMPKHYNPNRPKAHTQPPELPTSTAPRNSFWKGTATLAARDDEAEATPPSSRESIHGIKLSRLTQPPCPSHSPAACNRTGVEANSVGVGVEAPRRACLPPASHRLPLSPTPHVAGQHPSADEDSLWPRITSVSRKGFARIYEFLTRSIPGQMTGLMTGLTQSPDSGHFSPPPPPGGGGCAGPPP